MTADCLFCRIVAGGTPDEIIWQDNGFTAFLDAAPNTYGATVVVPDVHYPGDLTKVPSLVRHGLIDAATAVNEVLVAAFPDVGRVGIAIEGFGVDHLHSKNYPLHGTMVDGKVVPIKSGNKEFYPVYRGYFSTNASAWADPLDLGVIAEQIRAVRA